MARPKTGPTGIVVSTYLAPDDAVRLREIAEAADRSIAAEIRRLIRAHLTGRELVDAAPRPFDPDRR